MIYDALQLCSEAQNFIVSYKKVFEGQGLNKVKALKKNGLGDKNKPVLCKQNWFINFY